MHYVYYFFQSGLIHSKAMPQLVLSRSEHAVTVKYAGAPVEGYPVVIAKRYMVVIVAFPLPSNLIALPNTQTLC